MTIQRTATGYAGKINGVPFIATLVAGQVIVEGKPGFYLNEGETRQIMREIRKREAEPLLNQNADTKAKP